MLSRRVLLKVSGEVLGGDSGTGLCQNSLARLTQEVARASSHIQIAIVVGAGNICRGEDWNGTGLPQTIADAIGMSATHVNALAIYAHLQLLGTPSLVMGAGSPVPQVEPFNPTRARQKLSEGHVVILSGGTGNPFFTTDTCSVLRAAELECQEVLKATKVDGVYDADPEKVPGAQRFDVITFSEVLKRNLRVMDSTAFTMCNEQGLRLRVFDMHPEGAVESALMGDPVGTLVHTEDDTDADLPSPSQE